MQVINTFGFAHFSLFASHSHVPTTEILDWMSTEHVCADCTNEEKKRYWVPIGLKYRNFDGVSQIPARHRCSRLFIHAVSEIIPRNAANNLDTEVWLSCNTRMMYACPVRAGKHEQMKWTWQKRVQLLVLVWFPRLIFATNDLGTHNIETIGFLSNGHCSSTLEPSHVTYQNISPYTIDYPETIAYQIDNEIC